MASDALQRSTPEHDDKDGYIDWVIITDAADRSASPLGFRSLVVVKEVHNVDKVHKGHILDKVQNIHKVHNLDKVHTVHKVHELDEVQKVLKVQKVHTE